MTEFNNVTDGDFFYDEKKNCVCIKISRLETMEFTGSWEGHKYHTIINAIVILPFGDDYNKGDHLSYQGIEDVEVRDYTLL